jgi:predicted peroxiredoxin
LTALPVPPLPTDRLAACGKVALKVGLGSAHADAVHDTAGCSDPTRAWIPLHLAVNGSLKVGHDVGVVLAGDATELLKTSVRDSVEGVGVPPLRDLLAQARQHNVPVYV